MCKWAFLRRFCLFLCIGPEIRVLRILKCLKCERFYTNQPVTVQWLNVSQTSMVSVKVSQVVVWPCSLKIHGSCPRTLRTCTSLRTYFHTAVYSKVIVGRTNLFTFPSHLVKTTFFPWRFWNIIEGFSDSTLVDLWIILRCCHYLRTYT